MNAPIKFSETFTCTICSETKPYTEFKRDKYKVCGYARRCKQCCREITNRNRLEGKNKRVYHPYDEKSYEFSKKWRNKYPERWRKSNQISRLKIKYGKDLPKEVLEVMGLNIDIARFLRGIKNGKHKHA